jgi:hypothetical protein
MVQGRKQTRFPLEAVASVRIVSGIVGQDLQGHVAAEPRVAGSVDLAPAPPHR